MSDATKVTGCPVAAEFDPLSETYLDSPYPFLNQLREAGPVHYVPAMDYWAVTRYEDIIAIFNDAQTFSAANVQAPLQPLAPEAQSILKEGLKLVPVLSNFDPPGHSRVRKQLTPLFLPRRAKELQPQIEAFTRDLVDRFADTGETDIVASLTYPLPALTTFRMIGFPDDDVDQLKAWCADKTEVNWGRPDAEYQRRAAANMVRFFEYCRSFVQTRTHERADDLTSELLDKRASDPEALTDDELTSVLFALSFAGHETTTNLLGNAIRRLLERPGLWRELCQDPALIAGAVDETLRFDTSVPIWRRVTTRATTIAGVDVPQGARLLLMLGGAGHQPDVFSDPEAFDIRRPNSRKQLSFGYGRHLCLGQHLAAVEGVTVLRELTSRFPDLELVPGQRITFSPNISFRGPESLRVRWSPSGSGG